MSAHIICNTTNQDFKGNGRRKRADRIHKNVYESVSEVQRQFWKYTSVIIVDKVVFLYPSHKKLGRVEKVIFNIT